MAEQCIALCDYDATAPDELSFKKNDVITVLAKGSDSGFWVGIVAASKDKPQGDAEPRQGIFPNCFVSSNMHPNRKNTFINKAMALFDMIPEEADQLSFKKHDVLTATKAGPSPGWWYGVNETQRRRSRRVDPNDDTFEMEKLFPANFVTCNVVVAAYAFVGRYSHELSLAVGDVVLVHRRWNDGWWEGSLPMDSTAEKNAPGAGHVVGGMRRGIFPSNYTLPNVPTTDPPLFCPKCRSVLVNPTDCRECNRNDEIVRTMMRTLSEYERDVRSYTESHPMAEPSTDPEFPPLDLFQYIDIDPRSGRGALLSAQDVKDTTVRPRLAVPAAAKTTHVVHGGDK